MTTSQTTFLSKPAQGKRVLPETLAYMRARAKRRAYDLVIKEFMESGITKAELARRLGKGADRVSHMLGGPGNWTISTVSDLLFAIRGAEVSWGLNLPLAKPKRNDTKPHWLVDDDKLLKALKSDRDENLSFGPSLGTRGSDRHETEDVSYLKKLAV